MQLGILDSVTEKTPTEKPPEPAQEVVYRPKKSAKIQFSATILLLEAFVVFFATLVLYGLRDIQSGLPATAPHLSGTTIWILGGVLVLALIIVSRLCGRPGGYLAGSLVQVPVILSGLIVPMMFLVAAIFVFMWILAIKLGARVDRERAEYDAAHPETAPRAH